MIFSKSVSGTSRLYKYMSERDIVQWSVIILHLPHLPETIKIYQPIDKDL